MTWYKHLVAEYTGLSFNEIQKLGWFDYLVFRRDAFIHFLDRTEKGREYLDKAWILEQTDQDRSTMRELFGKRGKGDNTESGK